MEKKMVVAIAAIVIIVIAVIAGVYFLVIMAPKPIMTLTLTYNITDPDEMEVAELMKTEYNKLGIDLEIKGMSWDAQWDLAKSDPTKAQNIFVMYWWPTILSGYDFLDSMFHTESPVMFNDAYYYNSTFDNLIDTAYSEEATNATHSMELYKDAQMMLINDCPAIFFYDVDNTHVISRAISGYVDNPAYPHVVFYYNLTPPAGKTMLLRAEPAVVVTDLDPSTQFSDEIVVIAENMYESLTRMNPDGQVVGVLATNWTHSADGLTWNFTLRQGVRFHDGTLMNSTAVKLSIERTLRMGMGASYIWDCLKNITTFPSNPYLVQFNLNYSVPLDRIAAASYGSWIFSPKVFEQGNDTQIHDWLYPPAGPPGGIFAGSPPYDAGTGPYYLYSYNSATSEVVMKKFDDYWGGWNGSHYETIDTQYVEEAATREEGILGGTYDFTYLLPKEDLKSINASAAAEVFDVPSFQNLLGFLNTKRAPTNNKLVRQALAYAVPYQTIISDVLIGYGRQSRGPIPAGLFGHVADLFQYSDNLTMARELLTEAGYKPKGSSMTVAASLAYTNSLIPCLYIMPYLVKRKWDYSPTYSRGPSYLF
jgi:ABC-type transport system substrate-binding protein